MLARRLFHGVILTVVGVSLAFAQIDTTRKEFYPLRVGNLWQYRDQNNILYGCRITAQDSLFPNGQRYFLGCDIIRIDSSLRVLSYSPNLGDTCGGINNELNIYRLNEPVGARWRICRNIVETLCRPWLMRFDGIFTSNVFGQLREVMRFTPGAICSAAGDTSWYFLDWLLVRGIGIYRWETVEGRFFFLTGAIINGVRYGTIVGVDDETRALPPSFVLQQNYPNPFNPTTTIAYDLPEEAHVTLKVHDIIGREIAVLVNETQRAGSYQKAFDASLLASGVYVYRLNAGKASGAKRMVVIR